MYNGLFVKDTELLFIIRYVYLNNFGLILEVKNE